MLSRNQRKTITVLDDLKRKERKHMKINVEVTKYKAMALKTSLQEGETLESKLADYADELYNSMVPASVRQYIEMLEGKSQDQEQEQTQEESENSAATKRAERKQKREQKVKEPAPDILEEPLVS